MDKLLLKIYNKFEEKKQDFIDNGLQPIAYMDLYRGQPVAPDQFEIFALPAIFFKYTINWDAGADGSGLLLLEAHSLIDASYRTDNISPSRVAGLSILKHYRMIDYVMRYLESENTSKLRLADEYPVETDYYNYQVLQYKCTIKDTYLNHPMNEGIIEEIVLTEKKQKFVI